MSGSWAWLRHVGLPLCVFAGVMTTGGLCAQVYDPAPGEVAVDPVERRRELDRRLATLRESLVTNRRTMDRLVSALIALRLGTPMPDGIEFTPTSAERLRPKEAIEAELAEVREAIAQGSRTLGLRERVRDDLRGAATDPRTRESTWTGVRSQSQPTVPAQPMTEVLRPRPVPERVVTPSKPEGGAPPGSEGTHEVAKPEANASKGPIRWIQPVGDHGLRGRAAFHAGRLAEAKRELQLATKDRKTRKLVDQFYLARTHERLGDTDAAYELFLQIEGLDTTKDDTGTEVLGSWATAARIARQHLDWLRDQGEWAEVPKPVPPPTTTEPQPRGEAPAGQPPADPEPTHRAPATDNPRRRS